MLSWRHVGIDLFPMSPCIRVDNTYSIWKTKLCCWLFRILTIAYSRKHILTLSLVFFFLFFSPWMCPFDSIAYSGFEIDSGAFGWFWNIFLILFWCHDLCRSVSQVVMMNNTNSIWSTSLWYQRIRFLTVAYSGKYILILSIIIIIVLFSFWMCLLIQQFLQVLRSTVSLLVSS